MARAPHLGRVKTRLGADIGAEKATAIYRDLLQHISNDLITETRKLCGSEVSFCWFADPVESIPVLSNQYPGFSEFFGQSDGDLGSRMKHALGTILIRHDYAALIGADIPDISAEHISAALAALREHDVVLGPTFDGGYYLIGVSKARGAHEALFSGIPWSSRDTFAKTVAACESSNLSYYLLNPLGDLDVLADFERISWRPGSVDV